MRNTFNIYNKIPVDSVKEEVERLFPTATLDNWDLVPDDLHKLAESAGIELHWKKIDWWTTFEYGHTEIPDNLFFSILLEQIPLTDTEVLIVTDECFNDNMAYVMNLTDLKTFIETTYPELHQTDFFQPNDMLFIFPEYNQLVMLHHEGYFLQFQRPK